MFILKKQSEHAFNFGNSTVQIKESGSVSIIKHKSKYSCIGSTARSKLIIRKKLTRQKRILY